MIQLTESILSDKKWSWLVYSKPKTLKDLKDKYITARTKSLTDLIDLLIKTTDMNNSCIYVVHTDIQNKIDYLIPLTDATRMLKISKL